MADHPNNCQNFTAAKQSLRQRLPNPSDAMSRRQFGRLSMSSAIVAGGVLSFLQPASAVATPVPEPLWQPVQPRDRKNSPTEKSPAELMTPKTQASIKKGLNFLLRNQVKSGRNRGAFGNGGYSGGVATASLAGLAMMCAGHSPGQGKYGKAIDYCVEFVLKHVRETGYISKSDAGNENMYGHGFSMLFLSQERSRRVAVPAEKE